MSDQANHTILVTAANSFVGGNIVKLALGKGYTVVGTARSQSSATGSIAKFPGFEGRLSFRIVEDITKPESYTNVLGDITDVIHVASPFNLHPKDNAKDLLDPAIAGSVAILEAIKRYGPNVKRIVATSSFASIVDLDQGPLRTGYTYDEKDWNTMSYETAAVADGTTAYCTSKALAEKAMWDWMGKEKPSFDLVTICPPWVFGPHVGGISDLKHLNESTALLYNIFDSDKVPPTDFAGFSDSRVLAAAHVAAVEVPEAGGQRFLVGTHFDYQSAMDEVREIMPELRSRLPEGKPGAGKTEGSYSVDGSKAERVLGIKYISLRDSMRDTFTELLEAESRVQAVH